MPSTFSIVLSIQNSGAISTMLPMATAIKAPTPSRVTLRSRFLCCCVKLIGNYSLGRLGHDRPVRLRIVLGVAHRSFVSALAGDGQPNGGHPQPRPCECEN